jgi:hypothetical protein
MMAPELFESLTGWANSPLLYIFKTLPNSLGRVCMCGNVEQALIGFSILHDGFGLSIDREHERPFRFLQMLHEFGGITPEGSHGLDVFLDIEHDYPREKA